MNVVALLPATNYADTRGVSLHGSGRRDAQRASANGWRCRLQIPIHDTRLQIRWNVGIIENQDVSHKTPKNQNRFSLTNRLGLHIFAFDFKTKSFYKSLTTIKIIEP